MSLEKAKEHLKKYKLNPNIMEFTTPSATVQQAAIALNCTEGEIAKHYHFWWKKSPS